ncbi:TPA: ead/Ea22-like family protein [Enterobacter cloacae]|uniref:ead/Ea22-like family protein n=1 Tax=Enterobacter cloacae TaxID=550 RepID=UPI00349EEDED|nr:ead/Ea22-like family protein [Enterobacter cloacae]HAS1138403.1 ead/Ea22-like family protein [Enterobacter cloacae]HAS1159969.1 ead/Ea22-like family protein [Enterobacter cloacae]
MSNIDKRALREAAEKASTDNHTQDEWFHYLRCSTPETVLALLDGLEAKDKSISFLKDQLAQLANFNPDWDKLEAATYSLREHMAELTAARKRIAELESDNAYIKNRHKELDLLIGKNILVMQAAIIEWQGTGDAKKGLAWIYNTLFGPGELPDESEKDAQAYFDRKYAPLDEELMNLHRWFWGQSEAEHAAAAGKGE